MNIWDILLLAAVACALLFAVRRARKDRRQGGCSCGCEGCSGCSAGRSDSLKNSHETAGR